MKNTKSLILLCALLLAVATVANAGPMRPGKWQVTVQMDTPTASMRVPPVTVVVCVTPEQAATPQPPKPDVNSDCTVSNYAIAGNIITWSISCPKQNLTGTGRMTFTSDAYEGVTTFRIEGMEMTQRFTGKYLGACDW